MGVAALNVICKITFSRGRIIRNGKNVDAGLGPRRKKAQGKQWHAAH